MRDALLDVVDATDGDARALPRAMVGGGFFRMRDGLRIGERKDLGPRGTHRLPMLVEETGLNRSRSWMLLVGDK